MSENNEKKIWDYLLSKFNNPYGVAAIMGNLMAESSMNPLSATGVKKKYGMSNKEYTDWAKTHGTEFAKDGCAYGLVQWCFHARKEGLWNLAHARNTSVGDLQTQLKYIEQELPKYKPVYKAVTESKNIREISDIVLHKYEKPANQSVAVEEKRAKYAQGYYDKYAKSTKTDTVNVKANRKTWEDVFRTLKEEL